MGYPGPSHDCRAVKNERLRPPDGGRKVTELPAVGLG
jgi:hypothetical protein